MSSLKRRVGALFTMMLLVGSIAVMPSASAFDIPVAAIIINGDAMYTNSTTVSLDLTCPVDVPGCTTVAFSDDGSVFTGYEPLVSPRSYTVLAGDGTKTVFVKFSDGVAESAIYSDSIVLDTTAPSVTVNQASAQADPTNASPITFTATFSEPVTGFGAEDVAWASTAGPISVQVVESGPMNGTTYTISTSGMTTSGTVNVSIRASGAQDVAGNTNAASSSVDSTVTYDIDAPVVSISTDPSDTVATTGWYNRATSGTDGVLVNVEATDPSGVTNITCTNNGTVVLNVAASSGSFVLTDGMQSVVCNATDGAGNTGGASVAVQVDQTLPDVTVPANITSEATGPDGAAVSFTVSASDALTPGITASCSSAADPTVNSGDAFPIGTTTITCSATDNAGNTGSASFDITVEDTTAPVVTVPADIVVDANQPDGAVVTFETSASDAVTSDLVVSCGPLVSGDVFPVGTTTITCEATDAAGNTGTASFDVTVRGVSEQFDSLRQLVIDSTLSGSRLTDAVKRIDAAEGYANAGLNNFSCVQLRDLESRLPRYGQIFAGMPGLTAEEIAITRDMIATLQGALGCAGR